MLPFRSLDQYVGRPRQCHGTGYDVGFLVSLLLERGRDVDGLVSLEELGVRFFEILAFDQVVAVFSMVGGLEEPRALRMLDGMSYETEFRHFSVVRLRKAGWPRTPMR